MSVMVPIKWHQVATLIIKTTTEVIPKANDPLNYFELVLTGTEILNCIKLMWPIYSDTILLGEWWLTHHTHTQQSVYHF